MIWFGIFVERADLVRFIKIESCIMSCINAVLTMTVTWLMFGSYDTVPLWGGGGLVIDLIPSTAIPIVLMCLTTAPIIRRRQKKGQVPIFFPDDVGSVVRFMPSNLLLRTAILCVVWSILFPVISGIMVWLSGVTGMSVGAALIFKGFYGFLVGASVCPFVTLSAGVQEVRPRTSFMGI